MTFYDVCETAFGLRLLSFTSTLKGREIVEGGGARLVASIIISISLNFWTLFYANFTGTVNSDSFNTYNVSFERDIIIKIYEVLLFMSLKISFMIRTILKKYDVT